MPPAPARVRRRDFSERSTAPQAWPAPRAGSTATRPATKSALLAVKPSSCRMPRMSFSKAFRSAISLAHAPVQLRFAYLRPGLEAVVPDVEGLQLAAQALFDQRGGPLHLRRRQHLFQERRTAVSSSSRSMANFRCA